MNRSRFFIITNVLLLSTGAILFFYLTKSQRGVNGYESLNTVETMQFESEAKVLDSLYQTYASSLQRDDPNTTAMAEALFKEKIKAIGVSHGGNALNTKLILKVLKNYQWRMITVQKNAVKNMQYATDVKWLKNAITEQESLNMQIRIQNQMVQQAIFNFPSL